MEFEWDRNKEVINEDKHGVSFSEAMTVFSDPMELTILDPVHSEGEYRFISMGKSNQGNLLVVAYTERYPNQIRLISARKATRKEKKDYEREK